MKIIFQHGDQIGVIHPSGDLSIEEVARKDVPAGLPYVIVEDDVVPTDRTFRAAWEADLSTPHGFGIGPDAWFAEKEAEVSQIQE
jgi:hypothetical protein